MSKVAKDTAALVKSLSKPLRRSRPRARRKGKRASLARQCDLLWAQLVKRIGYCQNCGGLEYVQAAHGLSRRYRGTRWNLDNGFCLCRKCHMKYTHDPLGWTFWLKTVWGQPKYDQLVAKARAIAKPDHAAILADLKKELGL